MDVVAILEKNASKKANKLSWRVVTIDRRVIATPISVAQNGQLAMVYDDEIKINILINFFFFIRSSWSCFSTKFPGRLYDL